MIDPIDPVYSGFRPTFGPIDKENECSTLLPNGLRLVVPAAPAECNYVRLVDSNGFEMVYWESTEWTEEPIEVMGAIMGAISTEEGIPPTYSVETCDLNNGDTVVYGGTERTVKSVLEDNSKTHYEVVVMFEGDDEEHLFGEGDRLLVFKR